MSLPARSLCSSRFNPSVASLCNVLLRTRQDHSKAKGTIWNLSYTGWRLSGDMPKRPGEIRSLTVTLPNEQRIEVPEPSSAGREARRVWRRQLQLRHRDKQDVSIM